MNDLVREYMEAHEYRAALKHMHSYQRSVRRLDKFRKFKRSRKSNGIMKLSFEVNLDEDSNTMKFSTNTKITRNVMMKKKVEGDIKIPKTFIAHIVRLGFDESDAKQLFESKDDWLGMSTGGRVLCSEKGCAFSTKLCSDAMFEHCRTVHNWSDHPCTFDNCGYVAFSGTNFKQHLARFHSPYRAHNGHYFSCSRAGCKAAFKSSCDLSRHEQIHNNDVYKCVFCPFVNARQNQVIEHQRIHFNTRDFQCSICQKAFTMRGRLNDHMALNHDTIDETQCPLCDRVGIRRRIKTHLRQQHNVKGIKWDAIEKRYTVPEQI